MTSKIETSAQDLKKTGSDPLKFEVDRDLFPYESHFMDLEDGIKIHYVDEGEGPVILMLHGNPTWSFLYRKMIGLLKSQFRVVAPDYPGFGLSSASKDYDYLPETQSKVISEFVKKLELKDMILVMQDWGGPIGLNLATGNPELVRGMVIGNTWAWPLYRKGQQMFSKLMGGFLGRWMARSFNGVWRVFMKRGFLKSPSKEELLMYSAPFRQTDQRKQTSIFPRELTGSARFLSKIESQLYHLKDKEVLFTWGSRDFAFQQEELDRFQSHLPNHRTHLLEASHFWQDERGEEASEHILDWALKQGWISEE